MASKINVWVRLGEHDMVEEYSLKEKKDWLKFETEYEPVDYSSWGVRDGKLVHAPTDLPEPAYDDPIEALNQRVDMSDNALLELADTVLNPTKGGL